MRGPNWKFTPNVWRFRWELEDALEPTLLLGPAISSNDGFTIRLDLKPCEHLPSILRAWAQKLLKEAHLLEQGV